jgi:ribosomal-protein-alanine N-acetyltransferase
MQDNIITRFADLNDTGELSRAESLIFKDDAWNEKSFSFAIESPFEDIIVLCIDNEIAGYLVFSVLDESVINIDNIAVSEQYRRRHFAQKMIDFLFESVIKNDKSKKKIWLEVRESNYSAISLYKKYGFIQNGMRPKYYRNPVENAVLMEKQLDI